MNIYYIRNRLVILSRILFINPLSASGDYRSPNLVINGKVKKSPGTQRVNNKQNDDTSDNIPILTNTLITSRV